MDISYLKQYAEEVAADLNQKHFANKAFIDGRSIVSFCELEQVNFFILKALFDQWKEETKNLKSPYFDFDNPEVVEALDKFMESLSFHIKVEEKDFLSLVVSAIEETLLLVSDYRTYFQTELLEQGEFITKEQVENLNKYIKLDFKTPNALNKIVQEKNKDSILVDEIRADLNGLLDQEDVDRDALLEKVNDLYPLDVVQLLGGEVIGEQAEEITPVASNDSEVKSVNDMLKTDGTPSLNDRLSNAKSLDSLKSAIGLNQKFTFIKRLFDSNDNLFDEAIDKVDRMSSYDEAIAHLKDTYANHFHWNEEEETVEQLFSIIGKRFK